MSSSECVESFSEKIRQCYFSTQPVVVQKKKLWSSDLLPSCILKDILPIQFINMRAEREFEDGQSAHTRDRGFHSLLILSVKQAHQSVICITRLHPHHSPVK